MLCGALLRLLCDCSCVLHTNSTAVANRCELRPFARRVSSHHGRAQAHFCRLFLPRDGSGTSPSRNPCPGRLAGQYRPGRHGSAVSLPCGSAVALPRPQPKLRRLAPRRSQVSPPAHTHMHVPHKCAMLRAAMSGGDGLPPSSLGIAGRPEEATAANNTCNLGEAPYTNRGMRHVGEALLTNRGSATWIIM